MVLVQEWPLFQRFFFGNIGKENVFYYIPKRKNAFLGHKKKSSKSRKIGVFANFLTDGFGPTMAIFSTFLFKTISARKMYFTIF